MTEPTHRQLLRLRTLAMTKDIAHGDLMTTRQDRLAALELVKPGLTGAAADALIASWESAPDALRPWQERDEDFTRRYGWQVLRLQCTKILKCA